MPAPRRASSQPLPSRWLPGAARRAVVATLLAALALAACSSRSGETSPADDEAGAAPETTDTIEVVDQRGETVVLDGPAEEIVFAVIPAPAIFSAVDGSYDRVVGINQSTLVANEDGMFASIFPDSTESEVVAGSDFVPNVETIIELDPDVVIQWGDRGDDITGPIEAAGYPVIGLQYGTQEDLETWIELFSTIAGKPERGDQLNAWMHERIDAIAAETEAAGGDRPRVLTLRQSGEGYSTTNSSNYEAFWIDLAGGEMVSADFEASSGVVSPEQIVSWDPEVIIVGTFDDLSPDDIYGDEHLASVDAVQNRRVYKNPLGGYRWEVPNAESPLMWQWVYDILHPEEAETDLREQIVAAFDDLYGYPITDDEIDEVLHLDLNGQSAGYDKFAR